MTGDPFFLLQPQHLLDMVLQAFSNFFARSMHGQRGVRAARQARSDAFASQLRSWRTLWLRLLGLCRVPYLDRQAFSERGKGPFDLVQARMVVEIEQPVHGRLRNSEPAREFHLLDARSPKCRVQLRLCRVQSSPANHAIRSE